nr:MazG nucleotide pyrophosphohydrolase domain-containing protein [Micrococcus sp. JXJ CY 30]
MRTHCPWTRSLTHGALTEYLVEEAYEAVEEIGARTDAQWADTAARRADGAYAALAGELGDVLFQVVLHAAVSRHPDAPASEAGFRVADAAEALTAKMVRRNPLVFTPDGRVRPAEELAGITPEDVELAWERAKRRERATADAPHGDAAPASPADAPDAGFGGIPARLPALAAAAAVVDRAGRQEADPLAAHAPVSDTPAAWADEAALGAELFALVRRARAAGLDPERALRDVVARVRTGDWGALG